jgi:hypothetical protein
VGAGTLLPRNKAARNKPDSSIVPITVSSATLCSLGASFRQLSSERAALRSLTKRACAALT